MQRNSRLPDGHQHQLLAYQQEIAKGWCPVVVIVRVLDFKNFCNMLALWLNPMLRLKLINLHNYSHGGDHISGIKTYLRMNLKFQKRISIFE